MQATSFLQSFPAWNSESDPDGKHTEVDVDWSAFEEECVVGDESEPEEEDLQEDESHVPLNASAQQLLGDPEQVASMVSTRFWAYTHTSSNTMLYACPPPGYACTYMPRQGNTADAEDMMHCLQVMIGPDTSHQASIDASAPVDSLSTQTLKECDDLLARLGTAQSQLESHMREYFGQLNKSMTKAGQGRVDRFRGPRKLDECKADAHDGYISTN